MWYRKLIEKSPLTDHWRWVRLGDVLLSVKNGIVQEQNFELRGFRVSRIETVSSGVINPNRVGWVNLPTERFKDLKLRNGDILFSHINSVEKLGNCAIYEGVPENLYHGMNLLLIRVNESLLFPYFLLYWLKSDYSKRHYTTNARRAIGQASLNQKDIRGIPVILPPLPEQRRIAETIQEMMQQVESAQNACEKQLEAVKSLTAAYLYEVFESEYAKKWERKRLREICDSDAGIWGEEPYGSSGRHFILRSNNIKDGKIAFDEIATRKVESKYITRKSLKSGHILIATSSGSKNLVGKSAIFIPADDRIYLFSNFTMRLRAIPGLIDSFYLYFYLQSPRAKRVLQLIQDTTTGLRNLDRKEFLKQLIPLPPSQSEQQRIANELKEKMAGVEELITSSERQLAAINAMPQAILRKAFGGLL